MEALAQISNEIEQQGDSDGDGEVALLFCLFRKLFESEFWWRCAMKTWVLVPLRFPLTQVSRVLCRLIEL
jgi:hypothetical protein